MIKTLDASHLTDHRKQKEKKGQKNLTFEKKISFLSMFW